MTYSGRTRYGATIPLWEIPTPQAAASLAEGYFLSLTHHKRQLDIKNDDEFHYFMNLMNLLSKHPGTLENLSPENMRYVHQLFEQKIQHSGNVNFFVSEKFRLFKNIDMLLDDIKKYPEELMLVPNVLQTLLRDYSTNPDKLKQVADWFYKKNLLDKASAFTLIFNSLNSKPESIGVILNVIYPDKTAQQCLQLAQKISTSKTYINSETCASGNSAQLTE